MLGELSRYCTPFSNDTLSVIGAAVWDVVATCTLRYGLPTCPPAVTMVPSTMSPLIRTSPVPRNDP